MQICRSLRSGLAGCLAMLGGVGQPACAVAGGKVMTGLGMTSPTLGRAIPYSIYLPAAAARGGERLPVLYLLHGHGDDERAWIDKGAIAATLDRNIGSGALRPLAVVMPAAGNSWYVDDAEPHRYGAVAKAFTRDLVDVIEASYPIGGCRQARAVGGLSMGGYGAMFYALDRPDRFAAVVSLSGSLFSELPSDIERRRSTYERLYKGVFGQPFDSRRFLDWNVFERLERFPSAGARPAVWLAAGERDFPSILAGTVRMHAELTRRGFDSELRVIDGEHTWELWQAAVEPALIWLSGRLAGECRAAARQ